MFGSLGFGEILVICLVLIIVVGPERLPGLMKNVGKAMRTVRQASREIQATVGLDEILREDVMAPPPAPPRPAETTYSRNALPAAGAPGEAPVTATQQVAGEHANAMPAPAAAEPATPAQAPIVAEAVTPAPASPAPATAASAPPVVEAKPAAASDSAPSITASTTGPAAATTGAARPEGGSTGPGPG